MTRSAGFTALFVGAFALHAAFGQTPKTIAIYNMAFDEPSPKEQVIGRPIILKLRGSASVPEDFHARVIRGTVAELRQRAPDQQGCVRFDSVVFPVLARGDVQMQGLDDPAWLRLDGEQFQPQDYTLVFETGDQPYDSVILIHQKEVANYFKFAFSLRLVPPEGLRRAVAAVAKELQQARTVLQKRTEVFQKATASECWGVRQVLIADMLQPALPETTKVGELIPCETNSTPVSDVAVVE